MFVVKGYMYESLTQRKRSLIERLFPDKNDLLIKSNHRRRYRLSIYMKCVFVIFIFYCLNLIISLKSDIWLEKSFESEYHLTMTQIDIIKAEENASELYGPAKNILPNIFLIENEYICGRSHDPETHPYPHVLIFIKSSSENFKQRQAIRLTWGDKYRLLDNSIRLAFVLGRNDHNSSVKDESKKYGDIIQIDKMDYYYYSSYKMVMMLRWINDYCSIKSHRSSFRDLRNYVLFVNDDYYIDLNTLLFYLRSIDEDPEITTYERRTFLTGEFIEKSRPQRNINDRWYVSIADYPYNAYPPYISSGCFLMTRYNARLFYLASKYTRLFYFDHIYMGLLAYSMSTKLIPNNELFSLNLTNKSICFRGYQAEKLIDIWNEIHQTNFSL